MAEAPMVVASAVILPESEELPDSATSLRKRRQSSISENSVKRPRLSPQRTTLGASQDPAPTGKAAERRKSGQLEERKRGQRLFGALLGTLSQSSSSTAQKRRVDIERKQQAKLKLQDDEFDEKKKQRLDAIMDFRRLEQKKYDKQSMQIRHSNLLAQARFLRTEAEPPLYYKPWELLPKEEERVKSQIEQAEQDVERETEEFDNDNPSRGAGVLYEERSQAEERNQTDPSKTVGFNTNQVAKRGSEDPIITDSDAPVEPMEIEQTGATAESSKDHHDDGGEVVEGDEDTVIY